MADRGSSGPGTTGRASGRPGPTAFMSPMLATLVDSRKWLAEDRRGWAYERKLDGLRCVATRRGREIELWSRNRNSFLPRFGEVANALASLPVDRFTIDGELVAHDGRDFVGFGGLQQHGSVLRVVYGVFDLLHLSGRDIRPLPLGQRKDLLAEVVEDGPHLQFVHALDGLPSELLADACHRGWEGLIAKRGDAPYTAGRSRDWVKLKCVASQELVIGGWTDPKGSRLHLGALLVGYFEGDRLRYAGKVGTGFTADTLSLLARKLAPLRRAHPPFADPVRASAAHWVEPRLVANIAFSEWTRDGRLRHPRFEGLRSDKEASTVVREHPVAAVGEPAP